MFYQLNTASSRIFLRIGECLSKNNRKSLEIKEHERSLRKLN